MLKNKTILVTGGAGFIGSNLCKSLSENNIVISLDNYFTGNTSNHHNNVLYITGSTEHINNLRLPPVDIVYHLGEYSRVEQSFEDISLVEKYNRDGTAAVLEYVKGVDAKLVYAASSTIFAQNTTPDYVVSPYTISKQQNINLIKKLNTPYAIAYFYNVYGPGEISTGKYATVIGKFANDSKNDRAVSVVSPGTQLRNFTHIDDIVTGLLLVGEKGNGDDYCIGHPDSYSILEIANMFTDNIYMLPERLGNRFSSSINNDKMIQLGWEPTKNLKEYISTKGT